MKMAMGEASLGKDFCARLRHCLLNNSHRLKNFLQGSSWLRLRWRLHWKGNILKAGNLGGGEYCNSLAKQGKKCTGGGDNGGKGEGKDPIGV